VIVLTPRAAASVCFTDQLKPIPELGIGRQPRNRSGNRGDASFLSVLWCDVMIFGACMALAIYFRKRPEYHRRLVFMASCHLMQAAFPAGLGHLPGAGESELVASRNAGDSGGMKSSLTSYKPYPDRGPTANVRFCPCPSRYV
jgi:hypothetical protein